MRVRFFVTVSFLFLPIILFADISKYISKSELMIYFPSYNEAARVANDVIGKFYGKNAAQMRAQVSLESKSGYQVDILDSESLKAVGLNPNGPVAYVHISDQQGYLVLSVSSRKKFRAYVKSVLENALPYRFEDDFVLLSETESRIQSLTNLLVNTKGFQIAQKKLSFAWEKPFFWVESAYLGKLSSSAGVSDKVKVPYGFSGITLSAKSQSYEFTVYSALLSERQERFMKLMKQAEGKGKFEIFDYIGGHPAMMTQIYLNLSLVYRYYRFIDRLGVLGVTDWLDSLKKDYKIYVDRDLIHNADGRFKLLIDTFEPEKGNIKLLGSIGVKNPAITKTLIDSLSAAVLKNNDKLYSFELFTHPFYHYQSGKISLYYGLVENDFIFASDKEKLTELVTHIYSEQGGFLESYPADFGDAVRAGRKGIFASFDVQSLLSGVSLSGFDITSDFLVGIQNVFVRSEPDEGDDAYGWSTLVKLDFYSNR